MNNVFEYLKNEGNRSFQELCFGPVDALVLTQLTYLNYDVAFAGVQQEGQLISLSGINPFARSGNLFKDIRAAKENEQLFKLFVTSVRYKDIFLSCYVNDVDPSVEKQFAAVVFTLPDGTDFVSYRGTDMTIVGWKEDFNLTYLSPIPAQTEGVHYLNRVAEFSNRPLRVGGHSKGGNLAVYSASKCNAAVKERIIEVYSLDGPGFRPEFLADPEFLEMKDRIKKYLPQSSIVGMLMYSQENYTVIKSSKFGIYQHDLFNWQIEKANFIYVESIGDTSLFFDKTIAEWLTKLDDTKRQVFFDTLYKLIKQTKVRTLSEFNAEKRKAVMAMLQAAKDIDSDTRKFVLKTLASLFLLAPKTYKNEIAHKKIQQKKTKIVAKLQKHTNNL